MTHPASGNPTWQDYPSTATMITANTLENIENAIDATKWTYRIVSTNTTALNNEKLYVDASGGARVVSAPTTPVQGTRLFVAATSATTTNTVTLNWTINGDTIVLTATGAGVHITYNGSTWNQDYTTTNSGRIGPGLAPSSAGPRNGFYDMPTTQYHPTVAAMRQIRGYLDQAATGSLINLVCMGDSRTAGYFTNGTSTPSDSWPSRLRAKLTAAGIPSAGTGLVMASNNTTLGDSRIVYGGTWNAQYPYRAWSASGNTATFTSDVAGSVVEVYYYSNSGTFTVKVGAGSAQSVTPAGGTNVAVAQYTGQSVSVGTTITVTATSASGSLIGFCVRNTSGVLVHSVAWSAATTTTLATTGAVSLQGIISYINPSILGLMISCNDPTGSIPFATTQANFTSILSTNNPNSAKFLVCESPTPAYANSWPVYVSLQYDYADNLGLPLFDVNDRWVSTALGQSAGLLGSDALHETPAGAEDIARSVARMLTT